MKKLLTIMLFLTVFGFSLFAQNETKESGIKECPMLSMKIPTEMVYPGKKMTFAASLDKTPENLELTYLWGIDRGMIIAGQGTPNIDIDTSGLNGVDLKATVKVEGIDNCELSVTGFGKVRLGGDPELFDEINNLPPKELESRFISFLDEFCKSPSMTSFIVNYGTKKEVGEREKIFRKLIADRQIDEKRVTFVYGGEGDIRTKIWNVLNLSSEECPSVSITAPSAVVRPGEKAFFNVNLLWKTKKQRKIEYVWSIDKGEIVNGQGTPTIEVKFPEDDTTTTAIVNLKGLPKQCNSIFSDTGVVCACVNPELVDEFGGIPNGDLKARLDNFMIRLSGDLQATGYIINYGPKKEIAKRERLFRRHFRQREFQGNRMIFINGGKEKSIRTRLWFVPAGADLSSLN